MAEAGYTLPMELKDTRDTNQKREGSTGQRSWLCKWEDRNGSWVPVPKRTRYSEGITEGSADWEKRLVCTNVKRQGVGAGKTIAGKAYPFDCCVVTAHYADVEAYDSDPEESIDGGMKVIEVGKGRTLPDGTPISIPIYQTVPTGTYRMSRYFVYHPARKRGLLEKLGTVNRYSWRGFRAETMRFDCANVDTRWDDSRNCFMDNVVLTFSFDGAGHNYIYENGVWVRPMPLLCPLISFNSIVGGGW